MIDCWSNMTSAEQQPRLTCPHKRTDFRYELWWKQYRSKRKKAKKSKFHVELGPQPKIRGVITMDTSKARLSGDVIRLCLKDLRWREYPTGRPEGLTCDIYWNGGNFTDNLSVMTSQGKVNKFPGMVETVRKINLCRTLDVMRTMFPNEFNFHPRSWFLPQQFADFSNAHSVAERNRKSKIVYIVKPDEGSQGDGIYLITDPKNYAFNNKNYVVQEYISKPMLLDNLKFDFRIYVLLSSLDPLEIYICREGLARFCTMAYQFPTNRNIHQSYMHLTNYSLNKRSATYLHTESGEDGSKRTVSSVLRMLKSLGHNTDKLWTDIQRVVAKTIIAFAPQLLVELHASIPQNKPGPQCFQILGFDILLTKDLEPILLEVNANPSMNIDFEHEVSPGVVQNIHSPVDESIKKPLIMDTLLLVAPIDKFPYSARCKSTTTTIPWASNNNDVIDSDDALDADVAAESSESSDDDYEEPPSRAPRGYSSLNQIYPLKFGEEYEELRVMEKTVRLFLTSLGLRGSLRMGHTGFRVFTRKCKLTSVGGFSNAALDIMYIDLMRRWEFTSNEKHNGLCYSAFVEAFLQISRRRFPNLPQLQAVRSLLSFYDEFSENGGSPERSPYVSPPANKKFPVLPKINIKVKQNNKKNGLRPQLSPAINIRGRSSANEVRPGDENGLSTSHTHSPNSAPIENRLSLGTTSPTSLPANDLSPFFRRRTKSNNGMAELGFVSDNCPEITALTGDDLNLSGQSRLLRPLTELRVTSPSPNRLRVPSPINHKEHEIDKNNLDNANNKQHPLYSKSQVSVKSIGSKKTPLRKAQSSFALTANLSKKPILDFRNNETDYGDISR